MTLSDTSSQKKAWPIFLIFFITALFITGNNDKVSAAMVLLMGDLHIGAAEVGLLVTISSILGGVAAVPIGAIMVKTGPRKMGMAAIVLALLGCILAAVLPAYVPLMISRIFDGLAMGMISVVVPTVIASSFPEEKRGLPMGIWSCWVSIGYIIVLQGAALLGSEENPHTWIRLWWALAAVFVVLFVLFTIFTRGEKHSDLVMEEEGPKVSAAEGFRSATSVLIMFSMLFLAIIVAMGSCYMPTYCNSVLGLDILKANSLTSLMSVSMIISGLVMGVVLNKTKKHLTIFFAGAVLTAILGFFTFLFPQNVAVVYLILLGFFPQAMYATLFTIAPSAARSPETVSVTIGLISFGQLMAGIAVTIGGAVIDRMGFSVCSYGLGIIGILLVVCVIAFNLAMKKKAAQAK